jgi:hypothetical protein
MFSDSQLETALVAIEEITEKKIEMFYVFHVISLHVNYCVNYLFKLCICLISADNFRPYLTSFQGNAFTDYINAVFVDVRKNSTYDTFFVSQTQLGFAKTDCIFLSLNINDDRDLSNFS